ncbi:Z1 domain-containing protein [Corallococcus terminator]|uniref:Endonuclease Z1 domain-containing protein n=1 Tax=Corallococcus terminator TaxID=2316733 RepID=A0A3A8IKQ6_9BACT|nr:Z1 domain-containing protein [Corallococcus terminator]RKG83775.1 hypothetical protein D7V88_23490 [Corallococcus terminator]
MTSLNITGTFYPKYRAINPSFEPETFSCAERTVSRLLTTGTSSAHPGILLGKVQSGKTRTFISVIALAFDNGYDIAIVLSKNSTALIDQTIKRLRNEFRPFLENEDVAIYDIMKSPDSFTTWELNSKLIFVAKKQSDNLRRLSTLVSEKCPAMSSRRVLIVDDEADNASVGYTKRDGVVDANKIAAQVSALRSHFEKTSFLQVTATPYALYLQPDDIEVANVAEFRPTRPAFTELVHVPKTYVGGETYFGMDAQDDATLEGMVHRTVSAAELERLKKHDGRAVKLTDVLTSSAVEGYRGALVTFIVGGCIQRINGAAAGVSPKKLRYSFLLHSEAGKPSHDWQSILTHSIVDAFRAVAEQNNGVFSLLTQTAYEDLARSLNLDGKPIPALDATQRAVKQALTGDEITIATVNSDEDVASLLDDSGQLKLRSPLNIFVGGQVLDRGVTLSNLIGFFYGRRPNKFQQDTVLQHSRMYGYRRPDLAVTRFYTSSGIRRAMFQMEEFDQILRDAILSGATDGGSNVVQFIRQAGDGSIVPCSPSKILLSSTQTLRPFKRLLPIGFQSGYRTGANAIAPVVSALDAEIEQLCGFDRNEPSLVALDDALRLLSAIEPTLSFGDDDDAPSFDWTAAKLALRYLSGLHPDDKKKGKVLLWASHGRESMRMAGTSSHATYIETPDSEKTEGRLAKEYAINHPILFLLRQEGLKKLGWNGTAFYWPIIRAQKNTPSAIFSSQTVAD